MRIDLSEYFSDENKSGTEQAEYSSDIFDAGHGTFPVVKKETFPLAISNVGGKKLRISGSTSITILIPCDRCLTDVPTTFSIELDEEIDVPKVLSGDAEQLDEAAYMDGTTLDVDQLIFGEILVSWPMKVLCTKDCKGICKRCGQNRNLAECACTESEPDPRMAAIQNLFHQYKEV